MEIFYGLNTLNQKLKESAITIGKFDGVHLGHQELIKSTVNAAKRSKGTSIVVTFDQHPQQIFHFVNGNGIITPFPKKIEIIERLNVDILIVIHFDQTFARLTPEAFVKTILIRRLGMKMIFVGPDFRFGRKRSGNIKYLRQLGEQYHFKTKVVPFVKINKDRISSTKIRSFIWQSKLEAASQMLGRDIAFVP